MFSYHSFLSPDQHWCFPRWPCMAHGVTLILGNLRNKNLSMASASLSCHSLTSIRKSAGTIIASEMVLNVDGQSPSSFYVHRLVCWPRLCAVEYIWHLPREKHFLSCVRVPEKLISQGSNTVVPRLFSSAKNRGGHPKQDKGCRLRPP